LFNAVLSREIFNGMLIEREKPIVNAPHPDAIPQAVPDNL